MKSIRLESGLAQDGIVPGIDNAKVTIDGVGFMKISLWPTIFRKIVYLKKQPDFPFLQGFYNL